MKHSYFDRIISTLLVIATLCGLLVIPSGAAGLSNSGTLANSSTVTIQMDGSGGYLNKSTGGNIVGGYWKYTSNDGLTGSAYCVNWGLTGVSPSKSLPIQPYDRNPKTMGVFAGGNTRIREATPTGRWSSLKHSTPRMCGAWPA